ncbi:MAG: alpha/beta fold hydrolase [Euryarchaeota archaeon]|nr:alpha/beta fold hydrolase [Euryarchaeota archaeon]
MATPPREHGEWTPKTYGMDYEDFEVQTADGLTLKGWHVNKNSPATVFLLHGYTVSRWTFYIEKMVEFLKDEPYNLVIFDFRAHGESEGKHTSVGDKEIEDIKAVLDKLGTEKNCLVGYSMGADIAIRALEFDNVCCAVADSPPIYMDSTGRRGLRYFANLPEWIYDSAHPFFSFFAGTKGVDIIDYAERVKKPLLLIAGSLDPLVKVDEVMEFYEKNRKVNPDVELWVTSGKHVRSVKVDPDEYRRRVLAFIKNHLD